MHKRRRFDNPTLPKRCDALVVVEETVAELNPPKPILCKKRVFRAGMCLEHYVTWVNAKESRRVNVTRHKLGIDIEGNVSYDPVDSQEWCHVGRCLRKPAVNMDSQLWCMGHFMTEQKRLARIRNRVKAKEAA